MIPRPLRLFDQAIRLPQYVGISLCWYRIPLAYSYDDFIEFVRFAFVLRNGGCSALSLVVQLTSVLFFSLVFFCMG